MNGPVALSATIDVDCLGVVFALNLFRRRLVLAATKATVAEVATLHAVLYARFCHLSSFKKE